LKRNSPLLNLSLDSVMSESRNRTCGDNANCAERITAEAAHVVVYAHGGHAVCAGAADGASGGSPDICQKANAAAIYGEKNAAEAVAGKAAAGGEDCYCLADMPNHAVYETFCI
jgi:hypothetical protein